MEKWRGEFAGEVAGRKSRSLALLGITSFLFSREQKRRKMPALPSSGQAEGAALQRRRKKRKAKSEKRKAKSEKRKAKSEKPHPSKG
jgi:hypothetical protein